MPMPQILVTCCCALISLGALVGCTGTPTPIPVATVTLIPSTATFTPTPLTPTPTPTVQDLPNPQSLIPTATPVPIVDPILPIEVTPDLDLTRRVLRDLADDLDIPLPQVQLVSVERALWLDAQTACNPTESQLTRDLTSERGDPTEGYHYVLLVGDTLHDYYTEGARRFVRCEDTRKLAGDLLITVDPVAAEMVRLVQERVAQQLDLSTRRVQLVDIVPTTWPDTSLGCRFEGSTYTEAAIDGYRIVVIAGTTEYVYHSDSATVIPCAGGGDPLP